jgi:hypothetical protein
MAGFNGVPAAAGPALDTTGTKMATKAALIASRLMLFPFLMCGI